MYDSCFHQEWIFVTNISNYLYILQKNETSLFIRRFGKCYFNEIPPNVWPSIYARKNDNRTSTLRPRINEGSFEKQGVGKLSKYNKWRSWNKRGRFLFISTLMTWMYRNLLMYRQVCNLWKETKVLKQCKSNTFVFKWFSVIYTFYLHYFTFLRTAFKTLSNIDSTTKWLFTLYQKF